MEIIEGHQNHEAVMHYKKDLILSRINGFKTTILEMIKSEIDKQEYWKCRTKEKGEDAKYVVHKQLMDVYNAVNDELSHKEKVLNSEVDELVDDICKDSDNQKRKLKSLLSSVSKNLHVLGNKVTSPNEVFNEDEICGKLAEMEKEALDTFTTTRNIKLGPYITVDTADFSEKLLSIKKFELRELGSYSARSLYENEKVKTDLTTPIAEGTEYDIPITMVDQTMHSGQSTRLNLPHPAISHHGMWLLDAVEFHLRKMIEIKQVENITSKSWSKKVDEMCIVKCNDAPRIFRSDLLKKDLKDISCNVVDHCDLSTKNFKQGDCEIYRCDDFSKSLQPLSIVVDFALSEESNGSISELSGFGKRRLHKLLESGTSMKVKLIKKYEDGAWSANVILGELNLRDFWVEDRNDQPKLCKDIRLKQGNVSIVRENTKTKQKDLNSKESSSTNVVQENEVSTTTRTSESDVTFDGIKELLEVQPIHDLTRNNEEVAGKLVGEVLETACGQLQQNRDHLKTKSNSLKDTESKHTEAAAFDQSSVKVSQISENRQKNQFKDEPSTLINQPNNRVFTSADRPHQAFAQNVCFEKNVKNINPYVKHDPHSNSDHSFESQNSSFNSGTSYHHGDRGNNSNAWDERARRKLRYFTLILYGEHSIEFQNSYVIGEPPPLAKKNMADKMRIQKMKWSQVPVPLYEQLLTAEMQRFGDLHAEFLEFRIPINIYSLPLRLGDQIANFMSWYPELEGILRTLQQEILDSQRNSAVLQINNMPPQSPVTNVYPVLTQPFDVRDSSIQESVGHQFHPAAMKDVKIGADQSHEADKSHDHEKSIVENGNCEKAQGEPDKNEASEGFSVLLKQLEITSNISLSSAVSENGDPSHRGKEKEMMILKRSTSESNLNRSWNEDHHHNGAKNKLGDKVPHRQEKKKEEDWVEEEENYPLPPTGANRKSGMMRSPTRTNFGRGCYNCGKHDHIQSQCPTSKANPRKRNTGSNYRRSFRNKNH